MDIALAVLIALLAFLPSIIGGEMANNPPTSAQARRRYRVEFIVIAIFLLGLTYFQAKRSKKEQVAATTEANKRITPKI
jgi:biopolymer transport protein ExbD